MNDVEKKYLFQGVLIFLLFLFLYLSFKVIQPFLTYIVLAFILAFLSKPIYNLLLKLFKNKRITSAVVVLLILLIIIIPSLLLMTKIVKESSNVYSSVILASKNIDYNKIPFMSEISKRFRLDISGIIEDSVGKVKDYFVSSTPNIIGKAAQVMLGLFIMFFIIFYALIEGNDWVKVLKKRLPIKKSYKDKLFLDIKNMTGAVIYGQALTSIIQGLLGTIGFFIFGIPNPVFWGVIMTILAFIPFLGTPWVFVPAGILELSYHNYVAGIGILIYGFVLLINIDNVLKPYFIGRKADVHPVIVVLGVFGGLALMGLIGLILGPLIISLFFALLKMNYSEKTV